MNFSNLHLNDSNNNADFCAARSIPPSPGFTVSPVDSSTSTETDPRLNVLRRQKKKQIIQAKMMRKRVHIWTSQDIISCQITPPNPDSRKKTNCVPDSVLPTRNETTDETTRGKAASSTPHTTPPYCYSTGEVHEHTHQHVHVHSGCD